MMFATGPKTLEITDYSLISKHIGNKSGIWSERFTVGGYDWVIEFYPQGICETDSEYVSIFVKLVSASRSVQAKYSFRLKDWTTSKWATTNSATSNLLTFSAWDDITWGCSTYIKRSVLEASNYLKDDTLVIKCTLWVACDGHHLQRHVD